MCIAQSEGWCIVVCISYAIYICFAGSTFIIPKGSEKKKYLFGVQKPQFCLPQEGICMLEKTVLSLMLRIPLLFLNLPSIACFLLLAFDL